MKYIIISFVYFFIIYLIRVAIPSRKFNNLAKSAIRIHKAVETVIQMAIEKCGNIDSIKEIELRDGKYVLTFENIDEAYNAIELLCKKALSYYSKLSDFITTSTVFDDDIKKLNEILQSINVWRNTKSVNE